MLEPKKTIMWKVAIFLGAVAASALAHATNATSVTTT